MKISFIYASHRWGGFDVLAGWLAGQSCADAEHELIVVDGSPIRTKSGRVPTYLHQHRIPLVWYGEPKPRTFPWSTIGYANAVNTGLIHATGTHVVVVHDFIAAPKDSLVQWHRSFTANTRSMVCGDEMRCQVADPGGFDDVNTWASMSPWKKPEQPPTSTEFKLGIWGGPMELFEECNGLDERADFRHGWVVNDLKVKAKLLGWGMARDKGLPYYAADHTAWGGVGPANTIFKSTPFADVPYEPDWTDWSANSFVLAKERRR